MSAQLFEDPFAVLDRYFSNKFFEFSPLNHHLGSLWRPNTIRNNTLLDLLEETQNLQRQFFHNAQKEAEIKEKENADHNTREGRNAHTVQPVESTHFSSHQHVISNGDRKYMKSFSESKTTVNGKTSSKTKTVEKNYDGINTIFEKIESSDGDIQTKKYRVTDEEFEGEFSKNLEPEKLALQN